MRYTKIMTVWLYKTYKYFLLFSGDSENRGVKAKVARQFRNFNKLQPKKSNEARPLPTQVSFTNIENVQKKKEGKILIKFKSQFATLSGSPKPLTSENAMAVTPPILCTSVRMFIVFTASTVIAEHITVSTFWKMNNWLHRVTYRRNICLRQQIPVIGIHLMTKIK
jgi:hypothetical protein